jgi:hypothetical protein
MCLIVLWIVGIFSRGNVVKTDCGCGGACVSVKLLIDVISRGPLLKGGPTVQERSKHDSDGLCFGLAPKREMTKTGPSVILRSLATPTLLMRP